LDDVELYVSWIIEFDEVYVGVDFVFVVIFIDYDFVMDYFDISLVEGVVVDVVKCNLDVVIVIKFMVFVGFMVDFV